MVVTVPVHCSESKSGLHSRAASSCWLASLTSSLQFNSCVARVTRRSSAAACAGARPGARADACRAAAVRAAGARPAGARPTGAGPTRLSTATAVASLMLACAARVDGATALPGLPEFELEPALDDAPRVAGTARTRSNDVAKKSCLRPTAGTERECGQAG